VQMQAGDNRGAAMRAEAAAPAANAGGPPDSPAAPETPPRAPVSQAFNPLLDDPSGGSRE
jgi:hypothetical protein